MQSNSLRYGPGLWHSIHMLAYVSRTYPERLRFMNMVNHIISGIDCVYCWNHVESNLRQLPPWSEQYWGPGDELGMFRWSVDFHNVVNRMLGKPEFSYQQALEKYDRLYRRTPELDGDCNNCQFQ